MKVFEGALERVRRSFRLRVFAYVVMPENVHLPLSEPERETLAEALKSLKQGVSRRLIGTVPLKPKAGLNGAPAKTKRTQNAEVSNKFKQISCDVRTIFFPLSVLGPHFWPLLPHVAIQITTELNSVSRPRWLQRCPRTSRARLAHANLGAIAFE